MPRRTAVFGMAHDLGWAVLAPLLAVLLREDFRLSAEEVDGTIVYVIVSLFTSIIVFSLCSMRQDIWEFTTLPDIARVMMAVTISVVATTFIVFVINRHVGVARSVPLIHYLLLLLPLIGSRILFRVFHQVRQAKPGRASSISKFHRGKEHVLLFGVNRLAEFYASAVSELADGAVEIVGIVSNDEARHGRRLHSHSVLGNAKHLPHFLQEFEVHGVKINKIVVCMRWEDIPLASKKILQQVEQSHGVRIELMDEVLKLFKGSDEPDHNPESDDDGALPAAPIELSAYFRTKRIMDVAIAIPLAIVALPLMVLLAAINRVAIGDPVLFWQRRPGRQGTDITVYKFRTMLAPHDNEGGLLDDDQRQTTLTKLVRRTRLDELPQLYNIITGEMSLIGPRPLLPKDLPEGAEARQAIAPGITGWAQVNGGNLLTAAEKLALDLWYVRNASLWIDAKVAYLTCLTILYGDRRDDEAVQGAVDYFWEEFPHLAEQQTTGSSFNVHSTKSTSYFLDKQAQAPS